MWLPEWFSMQSPGPGFQYRAKKLNHWCSLKYIIAYKVTIKVHDDFYSRLWSWWIVCKSKIYLCVLRCGPYMFMLKYYFDLEMYPLNSRPGYSLPGNYKMYEADIFYACINIRNAWVIQYAIVGRMRFIRLSSFKPLHILHFIET